MKRWIVLGFTADAVVGAAQDSRMAQACTEARNEAGRPIDFEIVEAPGEGEYVTLWFVSESAARVLDAQKVAWRHLAIGERATPPANARPIVVGSRR